MSSISSLIAGLRLSSNLLVNSRFARAILCKMYSTLGDKFKLPQRYGKGEKSIWVEFGELAAKYKPLNLGQGFPDFAPPSFITEALAEVANSDKPLLQQYTRSYGHVRLVNALAKLYSKFTDQKLNPNTQILVTCGAYEALFSAIYGHIEEGDEVIVIEPFFDCYHPMVMGAGGVCKFIPLRCAEKSPSSSADFTLDSCELASMFNAKTKAIILNSPNNPLGKVFTMNEMTVIANLCKKWNVLCISDEVYEHMVYKPNKHIRIATLPGMWERTITIGSAGKTFSVTGWKTGWAYGPEELMRNLQTVHQNCVYTYVTPIQEAIAICFEKELKIMDTPDSYFTSLAEELKRKCDYMVCALKDAGINPIRPDAGYFILADFAPLAPKIDLSSETDKYKDYKLAKWLTKNIGLLGIPTSAFYCEEHKVMVENYIRYCFIKDDAKLREAAKILKNFEIVTEN